MKLEFSGHILEKKLKYKIFIIILPVGAELFHDGWTDGQRDMTELITAFRNIATAPKRVSYKCNIHVCLCVVQCTCLMITNVGLDPRKTGLELRKYNYT